MWKQDVTIPAKLRYFKQTWQLLVSFTPIKLSFIHIIFLRDGLSFPIFKISLLKIVRHTVHISKKLSLNKSNTHMKYLVFELRNSVAFLETNFLSICPTAQEQDYVIIKWFRDFLLSVDCFGHTAFKNGPSKRTNVTKCLGLCYLIALLKATKHNWIFSRPELF